MWQSYGNCLYQKVYSSWEVRLAGIGLHTGCRGISGYCYQFWVLGAIIKGCIDECLEKKKGRFWGEAGADHLPSGSNKVKVWRWWSEFLLFGCCGWVVILGSASVEICWGWAHWETNLGVQAGSPHGSRMGYLPCLISCRLLQLNAGAQGEHLTSQFSSAAARLLVTRVCPVYLLDKLVFVFYGFSSIESCWFFMLHASGEWNVRRVSL